MVVKERQAKIVWLNWLEMQEEAEEEWRANGDESFFDLPSMLLERISDKCGPESVIEWAIGDLCEERGFDQTVMYLVQNDEWPWDEMVKDLAALSEDYERMIFMVQFLDGAEEAKEKIFLHGGKLTFIQYNPETGHLEEDTTR